MKISLQAVAAGQPPHISMSAAAPQLVVVFENTGKDATRVWDDDCSWGYVSLSLVARDGAGHAHKLLRQERTWEKNIPRWNELAAGAAFRLEIPFDPEHWPGLAHLNKAGEQAVTLQAVYAVAREYQAETHQIWTGTATSEPLAVILSS